MEQYKNELFDTPSALQGPFVKLSPSSLNLYLDCPRCFWLYLNKNLKRPSIPVATITTGLDRVVKEYFDQYRLKEILPPILEGKVRGKLIRDFPKKGWLDYKDTKLNAQLGGYLDECLDLGGNFFAALDHKTRGSKPDNTHRAHQFQMDAYTFLLEHNGFPTKKTAFLVYYIPRKFALGQDIEFEIYVSEVKTDPQKAQNVFYEAVGVLRKPMPLSGKECIFCQWAKTINGK